MPVLKNIHKVLGLENVMNEYGFTADNVDDFEKFYSSIVKEPQYRELSICLEQRVKEYFKKLEIPDTDDVHLCEDGNGHGIKNNGSDELVLIALILNTLE